MVTGLHSNRLTGLSDAMGSARACSNHVSVETFCGNLGCLPHTFAMFSICDLSVSCRKACHLPGVLRLTARSLQIAFLPSEGFRCTICFACSRSPKLNYIQTTSYSGPFALYTMQQLQRSILHPWAFLEHLRRNYLESSTFRNLHRSSARVVLGIPSEQKMKGYT